MNREQDDKTFSNYDCDIHAISRYKSNSHRVFLKKVLYMFISVCFCFFLDNANFVA